MVQGPVVQRGYVQVGIVGKPNAGKSTFFAAATMRDVGIAPVPFTTVEPNVGIGYVRVECHCVELGLQCSPRNSFIMGRYRFVPVQLIDVAGLVPGAWQGRGLGNRFLDHVRRAPVLVHVVDASGGTDEEGRVVRPGTHDPLRDVEFLEGELAMWMTQMLERDWDRVVRAVEYAKQRLQDVLYERLSGLGFSRGVVEAALDDAGLRSVSPSKWGGDALPRFARALLRLGKPMVIAANKIDGIRAAHCNDYYTAQMARAHNDANILCFGERVSGPGVIESMIEAFTTTGFEGGRHTGRVEKIMALQKSH